MIANVGIREGAEERLGLVEELLAERCEVVWGSHLLPVEEEAVAGGLEALDAGVEAVGVGSQGDGGVDERVGAGGGLEAVKSLVAAEGGDG